MLSPENNQFTSLECLKTSNSMITTMTMLSTLYCLYKIWNVCDKRLLTRWRSSQITYCQYDKNKSLYNLMVPYRFIILSDKWWLIHVEAHGVISWQYQHYGYITLAIARTEFRCISSSQWNTHHINRGGQLSRQRCITCVQARNYVVNFTLEFYIHNEKFIG